MVTRRPFANGVWLNRKAVEAEARALVASFNVKTPSTATGVTLLSGGNIQKLLLARELAMEPRVLVCNKPTTGLDVKTAQFVLRTLREQADAGKEILFISSEIDELLAIGDRIGVIYGGRLLAIIPRAEADLEQIGHLMLGGRAVGPPRPPNPQRNPGGDDGALRSPPRIGWRGGPMP
jgi:simple sugar transport system ATP-binding protein